MALGAVARPAEESLMGTVKETVLPAIQSGYRFLERSEAGKFLTELIKNQIEPMTGKIQSTGRQTIDKVMSSVPHDLHGEVLKVVDTGVPHTNIAVNQAANAITKMKQATSHLKVDIPTSGKTPLINLMTWNKITANEQAQQAVLGSKKQLLTSIVVSAGHEKGPWYAKSVADDIDVIFGLRGGREIAYRSKASEVLKEQIGRGIPITGRLQSSAPLERRLSSLASQTMTSLVAIPHLPQGPLHSVLVNGTKATVQAFGDIFSGRAKNWAQAIINSGALEDDAYYATIGAESATTGLAKFFNKIRQPGFTRLRQWHINFDAIAAKHSAENHARDLIAGDKGAVVNLKLLGLDPDEIIKQGGNLTDEQIEKAMYRGVNETMFKRHSGQTPYAWETDSVHRFMTMYKHYYFNVGRLFKDSLVRAVEADTLRGSGFKVGKKYISGTEFNKTLAIMATVFPAVGWMAMQVKNLATGKAPGTLGIEEQYTGNTLADQYINAIGYGGGLAMAMTMAHSARRRSIAAYIGGPHLGVASDFVEDSYNAVRTGHPGALVKDVTRRIPVVGGALTNTLFPPKKKRKKEKTYY